MNQGRIIEYIDQSRFVCTLCLEDKGNRLHLLTPLNREVNLSPKRAILISDSTVDTMKPREELLEMLKQAQENRIGLKGQIDVKELWMLVNNERESFDNKYLAQLVFGEVIADDHVSAIVRALFEDHVYFKMKDSRFFPNSEGKVDQIKKQEEENALKAKKLEQGSAWLKQVQEGNKTDGPSCRNEIIDLLVQMALYGNDAQEFKYGKELLSRVGITDIRKSREMLIMLGIWEEDENLDLIRLGIKTSFTKRQLDESATVAQAEFDRTEREDLRDIPAFTIDGPLTRDYDDALSLEIAGDSIHIGIHIADVAGAILPGSVLDLEAAERAASLYLPRRQIPMFPDELSQDILSLKQECDRRAISLLARFDRNGELLGYRFVPSVIRISKHLTYDEVNERLNDDDSFKMMYQMSQRLRQKRMDRDALDLSLPELHVKLNDDSSLSLALIEQDTPSRMIVAEFMILYNWLVARFLSDNQISVLFRTQQEPNERLPLEEPGHIFFVFQQRRKLSPLQIKTSPAPHTGLGLDIYTHATSPIRRYLDLVSQRQIMSFFRGTKPIYDEKELEEIRLFIEPAIKDLARVKRNRQRYWILKYLCQHRGENFKALILNELKTKYRIVLKDFLLLAEIKQQTGVILSPGQEILVKVQKADPWDDLLRLEYVDV